MESSSILFLLSLFTTTLLFQFQPSLSKTLVVDGLAEWKNPNVLVGDTIIFQHKYHYNLYIFRTEVAFKLCNFTQATLLTNPNSNSFTWHPSRPGFFYFYFSNGTATTTHNLSCSESNQKLPIKASPRTPTESSSLSPEISPEVAPPPYSGGVISSSPAQQQHSSSLSPSFSPPQGDSPAPTVQPVLPNTSGANGSGNGIPFINSNPAVPLPTGEVDAATIRPLPTSASAHGPRVNPTTHPNVLCLFFLCVVWWMMLY